MDPFGGGCCSSARLHEVCGRFLMRCPVCRRLWFRDREDGVLKHSLILSCCEYEGCLSHPLACRSCPKVRSEWHPAECGIPTGA